MHTINSKLVRLLQRAPGLSIRSSAAIKLAIQRPIERVGAQFRRFNTATARRKSSASVALALQQDSSAAGYAPLSGRRLISLSGPDAAKFLQGAITRSIYDVPEDDSKFDGPIRKHAIFAAFLTAQGRVLNDVFIYPNTVAIGTASAVSNTPLECETFLVEVDAKEAERLAKHIKLYKLRAKFDVRVLNAEEASVWQAWGSAMSTADNIPPSSPRDQDGYIRFLDTRAPGLGARFVSWGEKPPKLISSELPSLTEGDYTLRRYLNGVAEGQDEILRGSALPLESNLDLMGGIDFRKGCYVGQELTIRTKHRGVVRKRILPVKLQFPNGSDPEPEYQHDRVIIAPFDIVRRGKKGRSAGKFLAARGAVGLALCRLEVMTDLKVPGAEGSSAVGGGFNPEDEFEVDIGAASQMPQVVKVKPLIPEWLRKRLQPTLER